MSYLPPQNPHDYPRIEGAGYLRNTPMPVPYGRYNPPVGQTSAAGFGSIDPVLMEVQRKRSATRKVSVAGSIIGLITMSIQVIATTTLFVTSVVPRDPSLEFTFLDFIGLLAMIFTPFVVGLGWIVTFILGLIACIRANSRTPQVQPDGWIEAKMPTSALLAASIVAGLPTLAILLTWCWQIHHGIDDGGTDTYVLYTVLVASYLVQILIAVGFIVLLRRSKALDPSVRVS